MIEETGARVEEDTVPEVAPEAAPAPEATPAPSPVPEAGPCDVPRATPVAWWPFLVYLTLWAALVATTVYLLAGPDVVVPALENPAYPALLLATVALTAFGPLLAVLTWAVAWFASSPGCRGGLLTMALVRGAATTLFGVLAWWVALVVIDAIRLDML